MIVVVVVVVAVAVADSVSNIDQVDHALAVVELHREDTLDAYSLTNSSIYR